MTFSQIQKSVESIPHNFVVQQVAYSQGPTQPTFVGFRSRRPRIFNITDFFMELFAAR